MPIGAPPASGEKVVYALHGGSYVWMFASLTDLFTNITRRSVGPVNIARGLLKHCAPVKLIFAVEYRLLRVPPRPARQSVPLALLDALATSIWSMLSASPPTMSSSNATPEVRYFPTARDHRAAWLLLSPWTDISQTNQQPGASSHTCVDSDYIGGAASASLKYVCVAFLGPFGEEGARSLHLARERRRGDEAGFVQGWPRTFVVAGEAER